MQIGRFRIGMRTMKTALAVMFCILLYHFLNRGQPMIAALAAVFALRQDLTTSVKFAKSRVLGNTLGGLAGIGYHLLQQRFDDSFLIELIILPLLVASLIIFSDGIDNNSGIISSIATMLLITLTVSTDETVIVAVDRVLDTFIGTFVAIGMNFIIRPPKPEEEKEIKEDLEVLKEKEVALQKDLAKIQTQIKKEENKPHN